MAAQLRQTNGPSFRWLEVVHRPRHQLLAGAALAANQADRIGAGHAADLRLDLTQGRAGADQLALDAQLVAQRTVLSRQRFSQAHLVYGVAKLLGDRDGELQVFGVERSVRFGAV